MSELGGLNPASRQTARFKARQHIQDPVAATLRLWLLDVEDCGSHEPVSVFADVTSAGCATYLPFWASAVPCCDQLDLHSTDLYGLYGSPVRMVACSAAMSLNHHQSILLRPSTAGRCGVSLSQRSTLSFAISSLNPILKSLLGHFCRTCPLTFPCTSCQTSLRGEEARQALADWASQMCFPAINIWKSQQLHW